MDLTKIYLFMARFITRIELHNADSDDYEILHQEMEREDFNKTIESDDNIEYHLPDGEYFYNKVIPFDLDKKDYEIVLEKDELLIESDTYWVFSDPLKVRLNILTYWITYVKKYDVIIEKDEDGIYVASVPELPGCHTQVDTIKEVMKKISEAIELYVEYW